MNSLPRFLERLKKSAQDQGKYEIKCEKQEVVEMNKPQNTGNKPEKKFSTGAIVATVWKNNGTSKRDGSQVEFRTIQLDRHYKDKDGTWKSTSSLRVNDLPKAALVLNKAYEYLVLREQSSPQSGDLEIEEEIIM